MLRKIGSLVSFTILDLLYTTDNIVVERLPIEDILSEYEGLPEAERTRLVDEGRNAIDPRGDPRTFVLGQPVERFRDTLPQDQRPRFEAFIYGMRIVALDPFDEGRCCGIMCRLSTYY